MKRIDVLIMDDNPTIGYKIKKRIFDASSNYKQQSDLDFYAHYVEIDNHDPAKAAAAANIYIQDNDISYLLLDRGFGTVIDGNDVRAPDKNILYKDNSITGYYIESLLKEIKLLRNNGLKNIKGAIVYTYDDYRAENKEGEAIKGEIVGALSEILPKACSIDVLLTYSNIYKVADIDLYSGYDEPGIIEIGKKKDFVLYGLFTGELLYHKLVQMINSHTAAILREKKNQTLLRMIVLYLILLSITVGGNVIASYFLSDSKIAILISSVVVGLILPLFVLFYKPAILIDTKEQEMNL